MTSPQPAEWKPTAAWHAKTITVILVLAVLAFFALKWATDRLPEPFAKKRPAPQTTPWLGTQQD